MFTDMVESTEMTARLGDLAATELVRAHDALVRRALAQHDGREVKHLGDGIMASFDAAQAAVGCAREIQSSFERYNQASAEPIHIRIGLDCGEPIEDSHDLFGSTVQRASRICSAASTDQILVSNRVREEYHDQSSFADYGSKNLKGFRQPVQVFECKWRVEM
jgi:class 3 adenylate cyclase